VFSHHNEKKRAAARKLPSAPRASMIRSHPRAHRGARADRVSATRRSGSPLLYLTLLTFHAPTGARRCAGGIDHQLKLVTRLFRVLLDQPVADEAARRSTFEVPELAGAVRGPWTSRMMKVVRAGVSDYSFTVADELDRMLLIEHGERVVREHATAGWREPKPPTR